MLGDCFILLHLPDALIVLPIMHYKYALRSCRHRSELRPVLRIVEHVGKLLKLVGQLYALPAVNHFHRGHTFRQQRYSLFEVA